MGEELIPKVVLFDDEITYIIKRKRKDQATEPDK